MGQVTYLSKPQQTLLMPTLDQVKRPLRCAAAIRRTLLQERLVREMLDGRSLYYAGCQAVLAGHKTAKKIMGYSSLQRVLMGCFTRVMLRQLDEKKYWFANNEAGGHLDHRDNILHDVAIYEKAVLSADQLNTCHVQVPAKVVEIDVQDLADSNYVNRKIRKLLEFGTERLIWVFTDSQQGLVAGRGANT